MSSTTSCPSPVPSTLWIEPISTSSGWPGSTNLGSFFVTRAKSNIRAHRRYSHAVDGPGLVCDQTVVLTGFYSRKGFEAPLRRIKFNDAETGKRLIFLTSNFALPALTITQLYRDCAGAWSSSSSGSNI
jgi:hypothetical protein